MRKGFAIWFVLIMFLQGFHLLVEGLAMLPSLVAHYHTHHQHSHHIHADELSFFEFFLTLRPPKTPRR